MMSPRPAHGVPSPVYPEHEHGRQLTRRGMLLGMGVLMLAGCSVSSVSRFFPPPPRTRPLEHGVCLPGGPADRAGVSAYEAMIGSPIQWVLLFCDWALERPPLQALDAALTHGSVPVLTWEPWHAPSPKALPSEVAEQPRFSLRTIAAGEHDDHIRIWAQELGEWGRDVVLRFAHEMNGDWYPWGAGVQGNTAKHYVRAWRHVRDIFNTAGADNVRWCWAPNVPNGLKSEVSGSLTDYFPGSDVVDLLGLDGYNWGSARPPGWIRAPDLFEEGIQQLRSLDTHLPIVITETASAEDSADAAAKAAWITELFTYIEQQGDVQALIWFQLDKELDWRINSSPRSQAAYRNAVARLNPTPSPTGAST